MTLALIDGDIFLYKALLAAETEICWDDDLWTLHCDLREAQANFERLVESAVTACGADSWLVAISDTANFRKEINPLYKSNRKGRKPLAFRELRDWIVKVRHAEVWRRLEADDVLGILATRLEGSPIIVTIDKDLKGIPGRHFNSDKPEQGVVTVSPDEAHLWFLTQAIAGDRVDGYSGVPGLGAVRAQRLLEDHGATWDTVVKAYESKGLTEAEALMNARMAKILDASLWDGAPVLWTPTKLTPTKEVV